MKLVSILNEALIFHGIEGMNREEIYETMLTKAVDTSELNCNPAELATEMISRENMLQIPYDEVAFPHLRRAEFDDLRIIIGILAPPRKLKECDSSACRLVIMSLISQDTSDLYLKALAAFSRFMLKKENIHRLATTRTAEDFLEVLRDNNVLIRSALCADDLVRRNLSSIHPDDSLAFAIDLLTRDNLSSLPVVDEQNRLVGELDTLEVLRRFIPEYIFRMDHLDFLNSFEPFSRIFEQEEKLPVKDYMITPRLMVGAETPLIQFTAKMAKESIRSCFVVDEHHHLIGEIGIKDIVKKVLRG